jgi:hypothetical protein
MLELEVYAASLRDSGKILEHESEATTRFYCKVESVAGGVMSSEM